MSWHVKKTLPSTELQIPATVTTLVEIQANLSTLK